MKRTLLLIVILALLPFAAGQASYAIVNNSTSGQTAHDSLTIPFFLLDSAGNQVAIADGDSVHLIVWYPGGAVAFQDSGAYNDADITTQTRHGMSWYSWQAQVSDLDGTPTEGTYSYTFSVHDKTSAALWTTFTGSFQLYETADFDVALDEIAAALDTLQNQDDWIAATAELTKAIDSINAVLDTLQLYDGRYALAAELVKAIDSINGIMDTLQLQDDWVAIEATAAKALDSLADILDSLETQSTWIAHQTTVDSLYDSLLIVLDSLEALEAWVAQQTEVANIDGWDPSTGQVKADMTAISGDTEAADSLEEACDGYDDAGLSLFERIVAALDSLNNHDDWVAQQSILSGLSKFFGACDGCYQRLYPEGGTENKDSVIIIDPSLGNDSLVGKVVFYHGTTPSVYDSSYFYIDEPW